MVGTDQAFAGAFTFSEEDARTIGLAVFTLAALVAEVEEKEDDGRGRQQSFAVSASS